MMTGIGDHRLFFAAFAAFAFFVAMPAVAIGAPTAAASQEFRATIAGTVTDPSGLVLPGATVTALNLQTNETATSVTTDAGLYTIPFLSPGRYTIVVELSGFKSYTSSEVQLSVGQTATLNVRMQLGDLAETVMVLAEVGETSKADRGMVMDNTRVTELPLNARNPFMLATLSAGVQFNGNPIYWRPFDNGAIADWSVNGGKNRNNEFLLDGAPNNSIQGGNNIAYVPPVDAVQEFKIMTSTYDAQYGRTAGGIINVSLKSGSNSFHGSAWEFARRWRLDANTALQTTQGQPRFSVVDGKKLGHFLDQYGFQVDGPLMVPGLVDGRNKTFFMFTFEGYREGTPNPATRTVPDERQRTGDFSQLRDRNGNLIVIYDPATGRQLGSQWVRDPFPNNIIPASRIHPIAKKLLSYYPLPNTQTPDSDPWRNNLFQGPNIARDDFFNWVAKVDHVFSSKSKMFVRYAWNRRQEHRNTNGIETGPAQSGPLPLERINYTGVFDYVRSFSPTFLLNVRASANRYNELNRTDAGMGFDVTELGFQRSLVDQFNVKMFPYVDLSDYTRLGRGDFSEEPTTVVSLQPNLTWLQGRHTLRAGLEVRRTLYERLVSGNPSMRLNFRRGATQRDFQQADALSGNAFASFLLGAADSSGLVDVNIFPEYTWNYAAPWIQDDWKIGNRLTLNLGVRWDFNSPVREAQNRLNYGFDSTAINPVSALIDQRAFPGYQVRGGIQFAGVDGRPDTPYAFDTNNVQPRAGFAYKLSERTVIKGGVGRYFMNPTNTGYNEGFSVQTPVVASLDGGRTPLVNLSNPFPDGVRQPAGSANGLMTALGTGPDFANPSYQVPYVYQFSLGVERQLPWRTTAEISYVGSRTYQDTNTWTGFNEPSLAFRNLCDVTAGGNANYCNERVPNPFYQVPGFEGTTRFTSTTISRYDLARPFPQFTGGVTQQLLNEGRIWYDSAQVVVSKRTSSGLTLNGTYTFSKMIEQNGYNDAIARTVQKSPAAADRPHRVTISGVYLLPFGHSKRFLGRIPGPLDAIIGGWEVAGLYVYNSGQPWDLPTTGNLFYKVKDARNPNPAARPGIIQAVLPCVAQMGNDGVLRMLAYSTAAGCTEPYFIVQPSFTGRRSNARDDDIRRPSFHQFDVNFAKSVPLRNGQRLQLRVEAFNLLNKPMYSTRNYANNPLNSDFGQINLSATEQSNFPRNVQLGIKFLW
ncbi:MAG: hypothetical protein AUF76_03085 [Acidobacteria bacterium 13_1_20CM_2_65_9]|nr:MAG: hypothetical protein AUF76_03085 [Acidobacteria bacterium 13_1_20CM_2_65_9]